MNEEGRSQVRTMGRSWIAKEILGWNGVIRHVRMDLVHFLWMRMVRTRWLCFPTNCVQMKFGRYVCVGSSQILHDNSDMELLHGDTKWFCLLSSANAGGANDSDMTTGLGGQSLDHWRGVIWDPGIVGQQCLHVCYDCHGWAEWSFWTETESGCCQTITWELGYLGGIDPPCDVDRVCGRDDWRIDEMVMVVTPGGSDDIQLDFEMVVCMFCAYVLLCILPCFQQLLDTFGVCCQGFPRFASFCVGYFRKC